MKKISQRKTRQTWEPTVSDQLWYRLIQLGEYITLWGEREHTCANTRVPTCVPHKLCTTHSKQCQATIGTWNRQTNLFAIRQELSQAGNEAYGAYLTHSMLHSGPASIPSMCCTGHVHVLVCGQWISKSKRSPSLLSPWEAADSLCTNRGLLPLIICYDWGEDERAPHKGSLKGSEPKGANWVNACTCAIQLNPGTLMLTWE